MQIFFLLMKKKEVLQDDTRMSLTLSSKNIFIFFNFKMNNIFHLLIISNRRGYKCNLCFIN